MAYVCTGSLGTESYQSIFCSAAPRLRNRRFVSRHQNPCVCSVSPRLQTVSPCVLTLEMISLARTPQFINAVAFPCALPLQPSFSLAAVQPSASWRQVGARPWGPMEQPHVERPGGCIDRYVSLCLLLLAFASYCYDPSPSTYLLNGDVSRYIQGV